MEPELERRRQPEQPRRNPIPQANSLPQAEKKMREAKPIQEIVTSPILNPVRITCLLMGVSLITVGLVGFVSDNLMQAHLSYWHNVIHVASGVGAIVAGYWGYKVSQVFSLAFGGVYGLLGLVGFIVGQRAMPTVGNMAEDSNLWRIIPEKLEFGTADHIIHLVIAGIFLGAAYMGAQRLKKGSRTLIPR